MAGPALSDSVTVLREAVSSDWEAIATLHAASWREAYRGLMSDAFLDGPVEADRRAVWHGRLIEERDGPHATSVAEDGASLIGLCSILPDHDAGWGSLIDNLHVRPGFTRQRLGRRLLTHTVRLLPPGVARSPIHLTVLAGNARAVSAYERWGGRRLETSVKPEPDGQELTVHRYGWADPAALLDALA